MEAAATLDLHRRDVEPVGAPPDFDDTKEPETAKVLQSPSGNDVPAEPTKTGGAQQQQPTPALPQPQLAPALSVDLIQQFQSVLALHTIAGT